jgi:hypothetical protein
MPGTVIEQLQRHLDANRDALVHVLAQLPDDKLQVSFRDLSEELDRKGIARSVLKLRRSNGNAVSDVDSYLENVIRL